ncbi:MAG: hypothetical protein H6601_07875 [Flavobacteriales bacterium]|nr:hypothetical protein [Flavobacteriales bacterium]MCB9205117.1 hypothetical protein [Flavobacteriales bacterium]
MYSLLGWFNVLDNSIIVLFCFGLLFPWLKLVHLAVFGLLMMGDVFIQNHVKFESAIILTHLLPGFFFMFLSADRPETWSRIREGLIYLISIGFVTTALTKSLSGWCNPEILVIHDYAVQFNLGFGIDHYFSDAFLGIQNKWLLKMADYLTLAFQGLFIVNFVTLRFIRPLLGAAVVFHLLILGVLNIGVFSPYILAYSLIVQSKDHHNINLLRVPRDFRFILLTFLFLVAVVPLSILLPPFHDVVLRLLPMRIYWHLEAILTIVMSVYFAITLSNTDHNLALRRL